MEAMGLSTLVKGIFGTANERVLRPLYPIVEQINLLEPAFEKLSDDELKAKTDEFRERISKGEALDSLLPEAFATVREVSKRTLKQRHYDVQMLGGIVLHRGMIAEMRTGEGKTLVATLATYLNAIEGKGVHVVTVNDYLAQRDAEWMGKIHEFLGLTVGCIFGDLSPEGRQQAYKADVTYGTNNEFGFDYLRDNLRFTRAEMVQREFNYAIVDEVDSILIDEARTPLIISGPVEDDSTLYVTLNKYIPELKPEHYELDEKNRTANFSEEGTQHIEEVLEKDGVTKGTAGLFDLENITIVHHMNNALRAHTLFEKDKEYIVKDDKVIIIDEFTGRMMEGRRFSDGLHQALEAKENVAIQQENQTLASVTFQNYFRLYPKLSGMTGTALTEAGEFDDIYKLLVVDIPTNLDVKRIDVDDDIYRTADEKYDAIIVLIAECHKRKQPVLVGTTSIEKSDLISKTLKDKKRLKEISNDLAVRAKLIDAESLGKGNAAKKELERKDFLIEMSEYISDVATKKIELKFHVLNARQHESEADIIAQAGKSGSITIATNMAGRGTDIQLGGNIDMLAIEETRGIKDKKKREEVTKRLTKEIKEDREAVIEVGGLCVIGTERHESRRIDNQLRGRSGRQGDPGYTKFFLSAEDDLIRVFGADKKMDWVLGTMGEAGEPVTHPMLTKMMTKSQEKVEQRNYETRKNLLKFDDVMNDQRTVIFEQRVELMEADDAEVIVDDMSKDITDDIVATHIPEKSYADQWDSETLQHDVFRIFGLKLPITDWAAEEGIADTEIKERINKAVEDVYKQKIDYYGEELIRDVFRRTLLFTLDELWKDHLLSLDQLRQGINLRAYGQKDPLNEYKKEAFVMFENMLDRLRELAITRAAHMEIAADENGSISVFDRRQVPMQEVRDTPAEVPTVASIPTPHNRKPSENVNPNDSTTWGRVGRNEECPCGSGKKYKQCHGKLA
jgi:preprotein translocase subunit SecA